MHQSAVEIDQLLDQGQADSESAVLACRRGIFLPEPLEQVGQELGPDPFPAISHADLGAGDRVRQLDRPSRRLP